MKNKLLKISLASLLVFVYSCTTTKENNIDQQTTVKSNKGEITSISGARKISGIYPHLTSYAHARENGTYDFGNECGIGGLAVWNEKPIIQINFRQKHLA